jgi:hypothetical protein
MASAVVEIGAEGAEALAPEAEEVGAKVAPKLEEVGSKAASKVERLFGKKAAEVGTEEAATAATEEAAAAAQPAGRQTMDRLMDVGTGVMIGQSLQGSDSGSKAAQGATQTLAAVQAPPGAAFAPPPATTGAAERARAARRPRDSKGRFVSGGKGDDDDDTDLVSIPGMVVGTIYADRDNFSAACSARAEGGGQTPRRRLHRGGFDLGDDDDLGADADFAAETQDSTSYFSTPAATWGAAETAPTVVHKHPRPLAESFQIAILVVLLIIVIAVTITVSVKKPSSVSSFGYGMLLGAVSGATVYWVLNSRSGRPKSA